MLHTPITGAASYTEIPETKIHLYLLIQYTLQFLFMSVLQRRYKTMAGRAYRSTGDRAATRAIASQSARQAVYQARRLPPPDLTYGDMIMAERQAMAQRSSGRYQAVSSKEVKCFDVAITAPVAGVAWALSAAAFTEPNVAYTGITELNDIQQGATVYERIGVKVLMRSIRFRCTLTANASPCLAIVRLAVVYDRQPNGAAPAIGDVFVDCNGAGGTALSTGVNITNKNRFTVLRDQMITIDSAGSLSHDVDWFIPCRLQTEFKASGATIGDISTGSILLIAGATNVTSFINLGNIRSRIRYED